MVARGINYGTAFEIALKIRELSGLLFEAWSAADLMHGPVAAIAPGWPVIALAPSGPTRSRACGPRSMGLAARGARVASWRTARRSRPGRRAAAARRGDPGVAQPARTVIPGQVAAFRLARLGGRRRQSARPLEGDAHALRTGANA